MKMLPTSSTKPLTGEKKRVERFVLFFTSFVHRFNNDFPLHKIKLRRQAAIDYIDRRSEVLQTYRVMVEAFDKHYVPNQIESPTQASQRTRRIREWTHLSNAKGKELKERKTANPDFIVARVQGNVGGIFSIMDLYLSN